MVRAMGRGGLGEVVCERDCSLCLRERGSRQSSKLGKERVWCRSSLSDIFYEERSLLRIC